jgi:asparagine synthase (glutamine-hydrolysing)
LACGLLDHDERTLFRGIQQLRPATILRYQDGQVRKSRYWTVPTAEQHDEPTQQAVLSTVREEIEESVRLHLRGDVEVALSHSSGLDSHLLRLLIDAISAAQTGKRRCFTYCFPGTPYDEGVPVQRLLRSDPRWIHYKTDVPLEGFLERVSRVVVDAEEPLPSVGTYGYWLNARRAHDEGIKVLLDGQGADEVFAGYRYYYELHLGTLAQQANGHLFRGRIARVRDTKLTLRIGSGECAFDLAEISLLDSTEPEFRREDEMPEATMDGTETSPALGAASRIGRLLHRTPGAPPQAARGILL